MKYKISYIKSVRELNRRHIPAISLVGLLFFAHIILLLITMKNPPAYMVYERMILCAGVGLILGYSFFRYLYSVRQVEFFHALPLNRKTTYHLRMIDSFLIFAAAFATSIAIEMVMMNIFRLTTPGKILSLLWTYLCMCLIYLLSNFTCVLMITLTPDIVMATLCYGLIAIGVSMYLINAKDFRKELIFISLLVVVFGISAYSLFIKRSAKSLLKDK